MRKLRLLTETGDTIIEVMIALAILGSAFGIAYATANRGLQEARNAEEHSQALQFVDKQIELLRAAATNTDAKQPTGIYGQQYAFCINSTTQPVSVVSFPSSYVPPADANADDFSKYPAAPNCLENNLYHLSITYTAGTDEDLFKVLVRWDGVGALGRQQEQLFYKLHGGGGGVAAGPIPIPPASSFTLPATALAPDATEQAINAGGIPGCFATGNDWGNVAVTGFLWCTSAGAATGTLTTTIATTSLTVNALKDPYGPYNANMSVTISPSGSPAAAQTFTTAVTNQGSYAPYTFPVGLPAGTYDVSISYLAPDMAGCGGGYCGQDLNLWVENVILQ